MSVKKTGIALALTAAVAGSAAMFSTPARRPARRVMEQRDVNGRLVNSIVVGPEWEEKHAARFHAQWPGHTFRERPERLQVSPITTVNR